MELGSDPAVFKQGDNELSQKGNSWGTKKDEGSGATTVIAAVAIVVILAGGIVGALLYFKKTPNVSGNSAPVDQ